jgi:hypothetical protein
MRTGKPKLRALRWKSRENDSATTHDSPRSFTRILGADRDDPQPKFEPARMTSPGRTWLAAQPGRFGMIAALRSEGVVTCPHKTEPGIIRSVLMLSPKFHTLPLRMRL